MLPKIIYYVFFRECRKFIQFPGIEIGIVFRAVYLFGKHSYQERRLAISLDNFTQLFTVIFLWIWNDNVIWDTVAGRKPASQEQSFFDIVHPISDNPDLPIYAIPLLSKQHDISITMPMLEEVFEFTFIERLVSTGISKERSFIDQKQTITQFIHTDTFVIDNRNTRDRQSHIGINIEITTTPYTIKGEFG